MKNLLLFLAVCGPLLAQAQTIPNASFENWQSTSYDNPDGWSTSNDDNISGYGIANVQKVNPGVTNSAIKLVTMSSGGQTPDTLFAYITNGDVKGDPFEDGGVPFSQKPTTLKGNFKYSIQTNDTAYIFVVFKKAGTPVSRDTITITGTVPNFVFNTYALANAAALSVTPDSVIFTAVASNVFGTSIPGSTLEMDNVDFAGPGITQSLPEGGFDNWTTTTLNTLQDWTISGDVIKTTDKYSGTYAAQLTSQDDGQGDVNPAQISLDNFSVASTIDTLSGFYKYSTPGNDSVQVSMIVFDGNSNFLGIIEQTMPVAANYTQFKIPMTFPAGADHIILQFMSSSFGTGNQTIGSQLYLDSLHIIKEKTGINDVAAKVNIKVYPNPATDMLQVNLAGAADARVVLYDMKGSVVYSNNFNGKSFTVPVNELPAGLYVYEVSTGSHTLREKFVKE